MKWVTRKRFENLSKRAQYTRLHQYRLNKRKRLENENILIDEVRDDVRNNDEVRNNIECEQSYEPFSECSNSVSLNSTQENLANSTASFENLSYCDTDNLENLDIDSSSNFLNLLRQCCLDYNINHSQTKALLRLLKSHRCFRDFPKDSRTLLKTNRYPLHFTRLGDGVYWHIGFAKPLSDHLQFYKNLPNKLELELSTDGMSLSINNPSHFWPIQFRVINIHGFKPVIAGIYKGPKKLPNANEFFETFIDEVTNIANEGGILVNNKRIPFIFVNFIADAPARALVLNHFGHNATRPCSKCTIEGFKYENRVMVYLGVDKAKRTDDNYTSLMYTDHQKGESPLIKLGIKMVTRVPFEIMHLVYLGVTVRCFEAWFSGKYGDKATLDNFLIDELCIRYRELEEMCPNEFARRPRNLLKFGRFKATELRHALLYALPVIGMGIFSEQHMYHLLHLIIAMRILTSPNHTSRNVDIAERALKVFVKFAPDLYGIPFMSYNIHALQHLADDARFCGPLENCSAFIYENNMPLIKKNIRNHPRPLQQFANRLKEKNGIQHYPKKDLEDFSVKVQHSNELVPAHVDISLYKQYKKFENKKFNFLLDNVNNFCKYKTGNIAKIENILVTSDRDVFLCVRRFKKVVDYFDKPVKSSSVGIYCCANLSENVEIIDVKNLDAKCYAMPRWEPTFSDTQTSQKINNEFVIVALLHHL